MNISLEKVMVKVVNITSMAIQKFIFLYNSVCLTRPRKGPRELPVRRSLCCCSSVTIETGRVSGRL